MLFPAVYIYQTINFVIYNHPFNLLYFSLIYDYVKLEIMNSLIKSVINNTYKCCEMLNKFEMSLITEKTMIN